MVISRIQVNQIVFSRNSLQKLRLKIYKEPLLENGLVAGRGLEKIKKMSLAGLLREDLSLDLSIPCKNSIGSLFTKEFEGKCLRFMTKISILTLMKCLPHKRKIIQTKKMVRKKSIRLLPNEINLTHLIHLCSKGAGIG